VAEGIDASVGLGKGIDTPIFFALGAQWRIADFLSAALGYNSKLRDLSTESDLLLGFSAGARVTVSGIELGYIYTPYGDFGDVHRIGLEYAF
jgi:hypothetical protein